MSQHENQAAPHRARDIVAELIGQLSPAETWTNVDGRQYATAAEAADDHIRLAAEAAGSEFAPVTDDERRALIRAIDGCRPEEPEADHDMRAPTEDETLTLAPRAPFDA